MPFIPINFRQTPINHERITLEADEIAQTETYDEESLHMRQLLKTRLIDMDLSVRALNCLKAAEDGNWTAVASMHKTHLKHIDMARVIDPESFWAKDEENYQMMRTILARDKVKDAESILANAKKK